MSMEYPKLRYGLETVPVDHQGESMILLRDRMGYCSDCLLLSQPLARLLVQMNGQNSLRDLQAFFMRMTGQLLYLEHLQGILQKFDEYLFLENERFMAFVAEREAQYREDPVRRMRHAGHSYSDDPGRLRTELESFFSPQTGGPGLPAGRIDDRRVVGLVAPHIDLQAGGPTFAHAYKAAVDSVCPDIWIILGTGHEPLQNFFALTVKDFETPLGPVACDTDSCEYLLGAAQADIRAAEFVHSREHTIEFQAIFLSFLQPKAKIVPVLCSFTHEDLNSSGEYIHHFAGLLGELVRGRSAGIIASVDLAHVGPRYGDRFQPDESTVRQHTASDLKLIASLERCDGEEFIRRIGSEGNRRKICGVAPLYLLARALEGCADGKLLKHDHAVVDQHHSFVTFAGMVFHEKK